MFGRGLKEVQQNISQGKLLSKCKDHIFPSIKNDRRANLPFNKKVQKTKSSHQGKSNSKTRSGGRASRVKKTSHLFVTIPNYKSNDPKKQPLTILIAKFRKKCNFRNNHMVLPHHSNSSFWNYIFHLYSFNCITHNCTVIAL